ncbi:MAG: SelT/SelW/SelH family protein [bacterium]|nr:SelT/SelW/SelH family protein [bacterium]
MADDIRARHGIEAELTASGGGVFEVEIDGKLVFSKKALDRFPEHDEIHAAIDERR